MYLDPFPSPGALVYTDQDGNEISHPVGGMAEYAKVLSQQQDYLECQVEHFWNWFVGEDIPLNRKLKTKLSREFDRVGRRPKDFIKILVNQPAFLNPPRQTPESITYSDLFPVFKRCHSCHSNEPLAPQLTKYPFKIFGNSEDNIDVLKDIVESTELNHRGKNATMPPSDAGWTMTPRERDLLRAWISNGAKDKNGAKQISSPSEVGLIAAPFEEDFVKPLHSTYHDTHRRLLRGQELFDQMGKVTKPKPMDGPGQIVIGPIAIGCNGTFFDNNFRVKLGFLSPISGRALNRYLHPNYLTWVANCLIENEKNVIGNISVEIETILGDRLEKIGLKLSSKDFFEKGNWSKQPDDVKQMFFKRVVDYAIGKENLSPKMFSDIRKSVFQQFDNSEALNSKVAFTILAKIMVNEEYLTY